MIQTKNKRGVTFLELMLAIIAVAIILLALAQSTRYAMNVLGRTKHNVSIDAIKIMNTLSQDLRSSYLPPHKNSSLNFQGASSSMRFYATVALDRSKTQAHETDLTKIQYRLQSNSSTGLANLIRKSRPLFLNKKDDEGITHTLASSVKSLKFEYFNGVGWVDAWNLANQRPQAVRIWIQLQKNNNATASEFKTIIRIPGT